VAVILPRVKLHPYVILTFLVLGGAALRFWQLETQPLWLDEVITALISMGRSQQDVPLQVLFPIATLNQLFTVQPGASCAQIAQTVITESVHPPLFFCGLYAWMSWLRPDAEHWVWALRALPALFGVGAIAAIYLLNRVAFSDQVGRFTAGLMAVSPFAVYLSQEARHYTLPMLLITLALVGLVWMQQDLQRPRLRPWVWMGWVVINLLGLYTHYFCLLALVAQIVALSGWMFWRRHLLNHRGIIALGLAIVAIALAYLPWMPILLTHFSRPETDWLTLSHADWTAHIAPLYQTAIGWVLMVIALPIEKQPWFVVSGSVIAIVGFILGLGWQVRRGARSLWQQSAHRDAVGLLVGFTLGVLVQFGAIVYLLNKDITAVPRYNFVYYPGLCALLGASLSYIPQREGAIAHQRSGLLQHIWSASQLTRRQVQISVLLAGLLSSILVIHGLVFHKSYNPDTVARNLYAEPARSLIVITGYRSLQEIALGLSFALKAQTFYPNIPDPPVRFGFLNRQPDTNQVWRALPRLIQPLSLPLNLWVVMPEIRKRDYPEQLKIAKPTAGRVVCERDRKGFRRLGFPYQRYRCQSG
jgi:uncharacterized membrane protein